LRFLVEQHANHPGSALEARRVAQNLFALHLFAKSGDGSIPSDLRTQGSAVFSVAGFSLPPKRRCAVTVISQVRNARLSANAAVRRTPETHRLKMSAISELVWLNGMGNKSGFDISG
jgi:hypothetical protein